MTYNGAVASPSIHTNTRLTSKVLAFAMAFPDAQVLPFEHLLVHTYSKVCLSSFAATRSFETETSPNLAGEEFIAQMWELWVFKKHCKISVF